MIKVRLIPVLLLKNGFLVRSQEFIKHNIIGDPFHEVERFNEWNVDELIYLIIESQLNDEIAIKSEDKNLNLLKKISNSCFMPLTFGGQIQSMNDIYNRFHHGADKITINTEAYKNPKIISNASKTFGKQAIVGCIDYKEESNSRTVFIDGGKVETNIDPLNWAKELENLGVGEILLQSITKDGTGSGYDLDLINQVSSRVKIPVIALGGVGDFNDYVDAVKAGASAVSAANIWHFKEMADHLGKMAMKKNNIPIRYSGV